MLDTRNIYCFKKQISDDGIMYFFKLLLPLLTLHESSLHYNKGEIQSFSSGAYRQTERIKAVFHKIAVVIIFVIQALALCKHNLDSQKLSQKL